MNNTSQTVKRLFLLCAISVVAMCSAAASANPEPPKRQGWDSDLPLYGNVESVVVTQYKLKEKFGKVVRSKITGYKKYHFNEVGDVIKAEYNSDGSLREKYIYKYDSAGNMIEKARYKSGGKFWYKMSFHNYNVL